MTTALRYNAYGSLLQGEPGQSRVFAYNGEQYTPQTGLQYLRARHYDPQLGAFTTRDTYLGDVKTPISQNRYTYAHNNPVRYADPSGHRLDVDGLRDGGGHEEPPYDPYQFVRLNYFSLTAKAKAEAGSDDSVWYTNDHYFSQTNGIKGFL